MIGQSLSYQEDADQSEARGAWRDDHTLESDWRSRKRPANTIGSQKRVFVCELRVGGGWRAPRVGRLGRRSGVRRPTRSQVPGGEAPPPLVSIYLLRRLRDGLGKRRQMGRRAGTGNVIGGL